MTDTQKIMKISTRITNVVLVMAGAAAISFLSSCNSNDSTAGAEPSKGLFGRFKKKDKEEVAKTGDDAAETMKKTAGAAGTSTTAPDRIVRPSDRKLVEPVNPVAGASDKATEGAVSAAKTADDAADGVTGTVRESPAETTITPPTPPAPTGTTGSSPFDRVPGITSETPTTPKPSITDDGFTPLVPEPKLPEEENIIPPTGN